MDSVPKASLIRAFRGINRDTRIHQSMSTRIALFEIFNKRPFGFQKATIDMNNKASGDVPFRVLDY